MWISKYTKNRIAQKLFFPKIFLRTVIFTTRIYDGRSIHSFRKLSLTDVRSTYFMLRKPALLYFYISYKSRVGKNSSVNDIFLSIFFFFRSSHPEMFCKKGVLRNFVKFTGKHLCQGLFFDKVTGLAPATLLKKTIWHRCFPVKFTKFLTTPFFTEHLWWLLLLFDSFE